MKFCENSTFFSIWIFYLKKNKMKVDFGPEKSSFQGTNTETAVQFFFFLGGTIKTHEILRKQHFSPFLGYVSYIFPISAFLSKGPAWKKFRGYENQTNFWRKLLRKSQKHKKQKMFGGKCCENRTFWKKNIF